MAQEFTIKKYRASGLPGDPPDDPWADLRATDTTTGGWTPSDWPAGPGGSFVPARVRGIVTFNETRTYHITFRLKQGYRAFINGLIVCDKWYPYVIEDTSVTFDAVMGDTADIYMEWYGTGPDATGQIIIDGDWDSVGEDPPSGSESYSESGSYSPSGSDSPSDSSSASGSTSDSDSTSGSGSGSESDSSGDSDSTSTSESFSNSSSAFCGPMYGTMAALIGGGYRITSGPYASESEAEENCDCDGGPHGGIDGDCGCLVIFPHWAIDQLNGPASGDYMFSTTRTQLKGGEARVADTQIADIPQAYLRANIGKIQVDDEGSDELMAFNLAIRGGEKLFRYRFIRNYQLDNELIGTGDGSEVAFQLRKKHLYPLADDQYQTIRFPAHGNPPVRWFGDADVIVFPTKYLRIFLDDVETWAWDVNPCTGVVIFDSSPGNGVAITVTGEFFHGVVMEGDGIPLRNIGAGHWESKDNIVLAEPVGFY